MSARNKSGERRTGGQESHRTRTRSGDKSKCWGSRTPSSSGEGEMTTQPHPPVSLGQEQEGPPCAAPALAAKSGPDAPNATGVERKSSSLSSNVLPPQPSSPLGETVASAKALSMHGRYQREQQRLKAVDEILSSAIEAPLATVCSTPPALLTESSGTHDAGLTPSSTSSGSSGNNNNNNNNDDDDDDKRIPFILRAPGPVTWSSAIPSSGDGHFSPTQHLRSPHGASRSFSADSPLNDADNPWKGTNAASNGSVGAAERAEQSLQRRAPHHGAPSNKLLQTLLPQMAADHNPHGQQQRHGRQQEHRQRHFFDLQLTPQQSHEAAAPPLSGGGQAFRAPSLRPTATMPGGGDGDGALAAPPFQLGDKAKTKQQQQRNDLWPQGQRQQLPQPSREEVGSIVLKTLVALRQELLPTTPGTPGTTNANGDKDGNDGKDEGNDGGGRGSGGGVVTPDRRADMAQPRQFRTRQNKSFRDDDSSSTDGNLRPCPKRNKRERKPYHCRSCGRLKSKHDCPFKHVYSQVQICTTGSQTADLREGTVSEEPDLPVTPNNGDKAFLSRPYYPELTGHDEETGPYRHLEEITEPIPPRASNTGTSGGGGAAALKTTAREYDSIAGSGEHGRRQPEDYCASSSSSAGALPRERVLERMKEIKSSAATGEAVDVAPPLGRERRHPTFGALYSSWGGGGAGGGGAAHRRGTPHSQGTNWTDSGGHPCINMPGERRISFPGVAAEGWLSGRGFSAGGGQGQGHAGLDNSFGKYALPIPPATTVPALTSMSILSPSAEIIRWRESYGSNSDNDTFSTSIAMPPALLELERKVFSEGFTAVSVEPPPRISFAGQGGRREAGGEGEVSISTGSGQRRPCQQQRY